MRYPGRGLALDGRVALPHEADVDPDAATATLRENGTLEVRVPKAEHDGDDDGEDIEVTAGGDDDE
jgi:HSP20 family molecular chaperone IbpA